MKQLTVYFALAGLLGLSSFNKIDKNSPEPNTLRKEDLRKIKYENDVRFLQQNTVQNCENPNFGANWKSVLQLEAEKHQREQREWLCSYGWVYREWAKTDMTDAQALAVAEYKYTEFTKRFVNHPDLNLFKK